MMPAAARGSWCVTGAKGVAGVQGQGEDTPGGVTPQAV